MRPRLVLFDLDGTLVDHEAASESAAGLRGVWLDRVGAACPANVERIRSLDELPALLGY